MFKPILVSSHTHACLHDRMEEICAHPLVKKKKGWKYFVFLTALTLSGSGMVSNLSEILDQGCIKEYIEGFSHQNASKSVH